MLIRRARPDEAAELTEIAHASKRHWGYPEAWIEQWRAPLTITPEQVGEHETCVAIEDGMIAGFSVLICVCPIAILDHLWIRPEWIGRGVGSALFRDAVEKARGCGAEHLELDSDPNAEAFYVRMGARRIDWVAAPAGDDLERVLPKMRPGVVQGTDRATNPSLTRHGPPTPRPTRVSEQH